MNILITNFHLKDGGGHKTYIKSILKKRMGSNFCFFLAAPSSSQLFKDITKKGDIETFNVEFPTKLKELVFIIKSLFKIRKIVKENNIHIAHVNGSPDHKLVAISKLIFRLELKIIRTKHDSFKVNQNFFNSWLYSSSTDKLIVVSRYQFENIIPVYLQKKTLIIPNTVDLSVFYPQARNQELIKKFGIKKSDIVLVSNAGTAIHKGWNFLVDVVSEMPSNKKEKIKIILIGEIPSQETIEKYVLSKEMEKVVFFVGYLDDVRPYISIGDIGFVLSSSVETISYACREMMAMGKPVIVSDYAGLPENITDKVDGWVVNTCNKNELTQILTHINSSEIKALSYSALKRAQKEFGDESLIFKYKKIYK